MSTTAPPRPGTQRQLRAGGVGTDSTRPDAGLKVRGLFAFSSDLYADGMLWGQTVRSPHPAAHIRRIEVERAKALDGCIAVLTSLDVPGRNRFGLIASDQPVLAEDVVRFQGEAVAVVAATTPEAARRAAAMVAVVYEPLPPITSPEAALADGARRLHDDGNLVRHLHITRGTIGPAPVVIHGEYEVGMQDQAPLGTESGLAVPTEDGGIDLYSGTQWLHADRNQLATVLNVPPSKIRITLAGVGGAFGAKEDLSLQAHLCLLALATGRPVKMVYSRHESFLGHVHRHPARLRYEHGADRDGRLIYVRCATELDGGAYASTTVAVTSNAGSFAVGPYACPAVDIIVDAAYTNNPPCGAMRGFGAVQVAFAHEAQMDRIAEEVGLSPLEVRRRNALRPGDALPTSQPVGRSVPVLDLVERLERMPLPSDEPSSDPLRLPGGAGNVTRGEGVVRGIGFGLGFKNGGMPEGISDYATARVSLRSDGGSLTAEVHTAAAELGQGLLAIQEQIVRTELGVDDVVSVPADTSIGSAGTSSASRQTYMTGGAVREACRALRDEILALAYETYGHGWPKLLESGEDFQLAHAAVFDPHGGRVVGLAELMGKRRLTAERIYRHRRTHPLDPVTGQGDAHLQFIYAAHRAIVDVDVETGLVRVVELGVVQDVGRAINPLAVEGQMEGGSTQGLGLALMEELQVADGRIVNPSFTDYLIPTTLDVPSMRLEILELEDPDAPYGVKGAGEPSILSSTPAIVAAIRHATGRKLTRVPVRPDDLIGPP